MHAALEKRHDRRSLLRVLQKVWYHMSQVVTKPKRASSAAEQRALQVREDAGEGGEAQVMLILKNINGVPFYWMCACPPPKCWTIMTVTSPTCAPAGPDAVQPTTECASYSTASVSICLSAVTAYTYFLTINCLGRPQHSTVFLSQRKRALYASPGWSGMFAICERHPSRRATQEFIHLPQPTITTSVGSYVLASLGCASLAARSDLYSVVCFGKTSIQMQVFLTIATPQILLTPPLPAREKKCSRRTSLDPSSASRLW
eukprot:g13244.t1